MANRFMKHFVVGVAAVFLLLQPMPANAIVPWPALVRMVGSFATDVAAKFLADEASHYLHKNEYDELRSRLSSLEADVRAYRAGNVPADYREVAEKLQLARTRLDEIGQRLARVEGRVDSLEERVGKLEHTPHGPGLGAGPPPSSAGYFNFTICNRTPLRIAVAIDYFAPELGGRVVQGWKAVEAGQCSAGGRFVKGEFHFYAKEYSGPRQWSGSHPICVETGRFKRVRTGPYRCPNRQLKFFNTKIVDAENWTANIGFRPRG